MSVFKQVLSFISHPEPEHFEALALRVFRAQFESISPYRDFCVQTGRTPGNVASIDEVPVVSTLAFKYAELGCGLSERVFMTSGTTAGCELRGRHFITRLDVYRASALAHLKTMLFPDDRKLRMLALHPSAAQMPESSLSQMISWCLEEFGNTATLCCATREGLDVGAAVAFLRQAARDAEPVCILGTTAACGAILERLAVAPLMLAPGSRLMDTGGAKGQANPLSAERIVTLASEILGIGPALVINEYGMTEMCSQLYDATPFNSGRNDPPGERRKIAPPWLRVRALDPASLVPVARGQAGLLAYFDLANVGSVSALLTEDLGTVDGDSVRLLGRAENSDPRGCALAIAQFAAQEAGC